jgi:hypothetical protein
MPLKLYDYYFFALLTRNVFNKSVGRPDFLKQNPLGKSKITTSLKI